MNHLNFALVGCGRISKRHSELLGLQQIRNAKLVAVCDLVEKKAEKIAQNFSDLARFRSFPRTQGDF